MLERELFFSRGCLNHMDKLEPMIADRENEFQEYVGRVLSSLYKDKKCLVLWWIEAEHPC